MFRLYLQQLVKVAVTFAVPSVWQTLSEEILGGLQDFQQTTPGSGLLPSVSVRQLGQHWRCFSYLLQLIDGLLVTTSLRIPL